MRKMKRSEQYLSYLLRLWQSGKDDATIWRASLENPITGERKGFANLQDLFAFLEAQANCAVGLTFEMEENGGGVEI